MSFIYEIISNKAIIAGLSGWFIAQTIKVIVLSFTQKKFSFSWYLVPGDFPSSHSASILALTTVIGLQEGFNSGVFALAMGLTTFIIYDASVLRRAAQRQARSVNRLIEAIKLNKEMEPLRDVLGHTQFEILAGSVIGILTGIIIYLC
jgi:acid phosphatase family membrane protein YuiD